MAITYSITSALTVNGTPIKPETSTQIEIGYKASLDDAFLTLAWYQLNLDDYQTNTLVPVTYQDKSNH